MQATTKGRELISQETMLNDEDPNYTEDVNSDSKQRGLDVRLVAGIMSLAPIGVVAIIAYYFKQDRDMRVQQDEEAA